jgi:transposase
MLDAHRFCQRKARHEQQGRTAVQIAHALALAARTVASWLRQERFRPRKTTPRASKLTPFKPQIVQLLDQSPESAAQGFPGGYSIVKAYVRTVRPKRQPAFLTRALAPGACAQVDGGSFGAVPVGQPSRRLSVFVMVLSYSRMLSVACTVSQTMAHFLACHQHAFECFGGVPNKVMRDNRTAAVLQRVLGEAPVCTPQYLDFATHYGFPIAPGHVGTGNAQGRVENGVGSVKKHCLAGRDLPDFSALTPAARQWLDTVANVPLPSDTREQPVQAWHTERPSRRPLPLHPCDIATVSQGRPSRQCRLPLDPNRSSVPAHDAGQALTLKTSPDRLCLYHGDTLIARQARRYDRCQDVEDPAHPKPLLEQRKKARDHQLFRCFLALLPRAEASDLPREARRLPPHHPVRTIVALSDIYTAEAVAGAMEEAFVYEAFAADAMATLLAQRAPFTPQASALHLTRRADLLASRLAPPALSLYHATPQTTPHDPEEADTMAEHCNTPPRPPPAGDVEPHLPSLQLAFLAQHSAELATQAAHNR